MWIFYYKHEFEPGITNSLGLLPGDFLSSCFSCTTSLPNFEERRFLVSSSSVGLPTQQKLLLDLVLISTISDKSSSN